MDFNDSQQEAEFRKEAREFLEANAEKRSIIADKPNDKGSQVAVAGAPETVKGGLRKRKSLAEEESRCWFCGNPMAKRIWRIRWIPNSASGLFARRA